MHRLASLILTILFSICTTSALSLPQWCKPNQPCWPNHNAWSHLANELTGKLVKPKSPILACRKNFKSKACKNELKLIKNPFYLQKAPGNAESQGYWHAWTYHNSVYAVEAINTRDIVAAVDFARKHHLRLVIKGAGHDYLGRSNAPNSLLIWTHKMQKLQYHPAFIPTGAPQSRTIPAMTVGAGVVWLQAYQLATQYNRIILGGGCTTVGAAGGFTLGGGFGIFSKEYGTGATNLVQATVVTADGKLLIANNYQHKDLFWALRGGGGSFGVVTQMTYRTFLLPKHIGFVIGKIHANNDLAYKKLMKHLILFYNKHIVKNQSWGGDKFSFNADNTLGFILPFQNISQQRAQSLWSPFMRWVDAHSKVYKIVQMDIIAFPGNKMWNFHYWDTHLSGSVVANTLAGSPKGSYWMSGNSNQVFNYFSGYNSWWLPKTLFESNQINQLVSALFKASRYIHANTEMYFYVDKGLFGASSDTLQRVLQTSTNPKVKNAVGLLSIWAYHNTIYSGVHSHAPTTPINNKIIRKEAQDINKAMHIIKSAAPNAGTYVNETSYFNKNWQQDFWGVNYPRLLTIKHEYDPTGLFSCHHCVGSDY